MGPYLLRESSSRGLTTVIEAAEKSMTDISFPDSQYANTNEVCEKNNDQQDAASSRRHLTDFIKGKRKKAITPSSPQDSFVRFLFSHVYGKCRRLGAS